MKILFRYYYLLEENLKIYNYIFFISINQK